MSMETHADSSGNASKSRRGFLKASLAAGALGALQEVSVRAAPTAAIQPRKPVIDEHDAKNIKLAHRVPSTASDDELLFLKQIGLRWARVELQAAEADLDRLSAVQKRFDRHGLRIYSAMHPAYRSLKIQLGQAGRDADIAQYQTFLKSMGELGIPVA